MSKARNDKPMENKVNIRGYLRSDGRKGIRNIVAVAYLVECAHFVAREIVVPNREDTHLIGFPGCYPNDYAQDMMEKLCTHPNVGAVLLVSLGCESFNRHKAAKPLGGVLNDDFRHPSTSNSFVYGCTRNLVDD